MLTIFTTCKPCINDLWEKQQRQAMTTWTLLKPTPEILVMGTDKGTEQICKDLGFTWIPEVRKSRRSGVPYLNSMIQIAAARAKNPHVALISADVIVFQEVMDCLESCKKKFDEFCACCRKKTLRTTDDLDFSNDDWKHIVQQNVRWSSVTSGDFYMYNKKFFPSVPEFIIGRCACDTWLFNEAAKRNCLVDLSEAMKIIDYHHNHNHWKKGHKNIGDEERKQNVTIAGKDKVSLQEANWKMLKDFSIVSKEETK